MKNRERLPAYIAFVIVCLSWGTSFGAIRVALETLPTLLLTGTRYGLAGLLLVAFCLIRKEQFPRKRAEWFNHAMIGLLMIGIGSLCVVWAEHYVASGWAALFLATGPLWLMLTETLYSKKRQITGINLVSIAIGFAGVMLLVAPQRGSQNFNPLFLAGIAALQLACIGWSVGTIRAKYSTFEASSFVSAGLQMLFGGLVVSLLGLLAGEASRFSFTPRTLAAFVHLTLFGSIAAYAAYFYTVSKLSTMAIAFYDYLVPAIAVLTGWLLLDEAMGWRTVMALLLILSGASLEPLVKKLSSSTSATSLPVEICPEEQ